MKKTFSLIMLAMLMATGVQTTMAQEMLVRLADNKIVRYDVSQVQYVTFLETAFVDLELPSGTLWATCNVGACFPEEYGDYFAWGETEPKETYTDSNYKFITNGKVTKYNSTDGRTVLLFADDAATANLGSGWQMPSKEQWDELLDGSNTTIEWTKENGVNGFKVTSTHNGKSIFLPAAGQQTRWSDDVGKAGYYWSRSLNAENENEACNMTLDYSGFKSTSYVYRTYGYPVRPVVRVGSVRAVEQIMLSTTSLNLEIGDIQTLTATVLPEDAEDKVLAWESSSNEVATVSGDGLVTAIGEGTCTITCSATDGSGVYAVCEVKVEIPEFVDLGLPSGTLWATCNVGASHPEEYGDYFAWGETEPKSDYSWYSYKYAKPSTNGVTEYEPTKYSTDDKNSISDGKTELDAEDDAATVNMGAEWQMPSKEQIEELCNNTTRTWTTQNGVNGRLVTSNINGKSIFFPAAGGRYDYGIYNTGSFCHYW